MKEINIEELKQIQLQILLAIHDFCEENNIKYSLADGTLLGAIRHQGFIPWDDDIDICMPREEYRRFLKEFPLVYNNNISVISMDRDRQWARPWAKAYDTRTLIQENTGNNKPAIGIGIDVFPLDEVPNGDSWIKYDKLRRRIFFFFRTKALKWRKGRSLYKNMYMVAAKIILKPFSYRFLSEVMDKYAQKHNGKGHDYLFECCSGMILNRPFPKAAFDTVTVKKFEGHAVNVMTGYHVCLQNSYGDYMQLPPIEKRVTHHDFVAYWK